MGFVRQWTLCVCITLIISVIFSLLSPNGSLNKFYKIIISLFVFLSFLYPFTQFQFKEFKIDNNSNYEMNIRTESAYESMMEMSIKQYLQEQDITANVDCMMSLDNDVIDIQSIQIAVDDTCDTEEIESMIFEKFGLNSKVIHIGD
ncbi:MAG: stage III sporulation protein AF [Eubacterium sp.]